MKATIEMDFSQQEVRAILRLSVEGARDEIARMAGAPAKDVDVFFSTDEKRQPTFQRVDRFGRPFAGRGPVPKGCRTETRRVIVGRCWLQKNAPELWAIFVAAKMFHVFIPPLVSRSK